MNDLKKFKSKYTDKFYQKEAYLQMVKTERKFQTYSDRNIKLVKLSQKFKND